MAADLEDHSANEEVVSMMGDGECYLNQLEGNYQETWCYN